MNIWDKREHETAKAFDAFLIYRDMGAERSQSKVQAELGHRSSTSVQRWSQQHDWTMRVEAYDRWQHQQHELALQQDFGEQRREARERRQKIIYDLETATQALLDISQPGEALSPGTLKTIVDAGCKLLDQSRAEFNDLPTTRSDVTTKGEAVSRSDGSDSFIAALMKADSELKRDDYQGC